MMKLPHFTEASPSTEWLVNEQNRLHAEADRMIEVTGVMDVFARYGELSDIGGSYRYGTMIYPDLDIGVVHESVTRQTLGNLLSDLALNKHVMGIATADTANFDVSSRQRPKGYWIGVDIPFGNDRWGIDCWLQQPDWIQDGDDRYADRMSVLDEESRVAILAIKYGLIYQGVYGKRYISTDVYDAVLDDGVRSLDEFVTSRP